jgi:hypothetical protein
MVYSGKPSWFSFSSEQRKERKARKALSHCSDTTTSPTLQRTRGFEPSSDLPPPYSEASIVEVPRIEISTPEPDESQYAFLRGFDTIFLVDDSSSMQGDRWKEASKAIAAIAPICTQYDSDGIDIYFLNHRKRSVSSAKLNSRHNCNPHHRANSNYYSNWSQPPYNLRADGYQNITTARRVEQIFRDVQPKGGTMVATRLSDILEPYLERVEAMQAAKKARGFIDPDVVVKPINIITITDGEFTDDAEGIILKTARKLDGPTCDAIPWQVGIQFFQIGNDRRARDFLEQLDDDLSRQGQEMHLRDIVDTVPWKRDGVVLNGDGILKTVLGAVNKRLDRQIV